MDKFEDAMGYYNKALVIDPKNRDVLLGIATMFENNGNISGAVKYYDKLLQINPNDALALTSKANLLPLLNGQNSSGRNETSDQVISDSNDTNRSMTEKQKAPTSPSAAVSISTGSSSPSNGKWFTPSEISVPSDSEASIFGSYAIFPPLSGGE